MTDASAIDWKARAAAVAAADGDEWDRLSEAYATDWKAAYCQAFRNIAKSRGWTDSNIDSGWLDDLPSTAFDATGSGGEEPATIARDDVIECEYEVSNA